MKSAKIVNKRFGVFTDNAELRLMKNENLVLKMRTKQKFPAIIEGNSI